MLGQRGGQALVREALRDQLETVLLLDQHAQPASDDVLELGYDDADGGAGDHLVVTPPRTWSISV
jgi:hypothetical protein